jgi:sulfur-oxidizing protein SoxX
VAQRRQVPGRLEAGRGHRAERPRPDLDRHRQAANGGNCYNCHQISKEEISFGTIGPSLYNYGKIRGVSDPNSAASKPIVEYTWGKIWNAKAYNACSNMPRAGHMGNLTEAQIRDVMALLLDPASPVNK